MKTFSLNHSFKSFCRITLRIILPTLISITLLFMNNSSAAVLTVGPNSTLLLNNQPWRGIGVNYYDAFNRTLYNYYDTSYKKGFRTLDSLKIPFVRLAFSGFDSNAMRYYKNDKNLYYRLMDSVVACAASYNIGLIPSIIWNIKMPPQMCRESLEAYTDTNSATWTWAKNYYSEVVSRYKDSPSIWAWEIGNEFYPFGDLPSSSVYYTPITTSVIRTFFISIGNLIKNIDSTRLISSGNQIPQPNQYHRYLYRVDTLAHPEIWTVDTRDESKDIINILHPDPISLISSHIYSFGKGGSRFFSNNNPHVNETGYIRELSIMCREIGKPLFLGEFGSYDGDVDSSGILFDSVKQAELFGSMISAIEESKIPMSAMWVFDFEWFNPPGQKSTSDRHYWTATLTNNRAYQLILIADANKRIQADLLATISKQPKSQLKRCQKGTQIIFGHQFHNIPPNAKVHLYDLNGREIFNDYYSSDKWVHTSRRIGNRLFLLQIRNSNTITDNSNF